MSKIDKHNLKKFKDIYQKRWININDEEILDSAINLLELYSVVYDSKK